MIFRPITDDDLLEYVCGSLEPTRRDEVEKAARKDPSVDAQLHRLSTAYNALRQVKPDVHNSFFNIQLKLRWAAQADATIERAAPSQPDSEQTILAETIDPRGNLDRSGCPDTLQARTQGRPPAGRLGKMRPVFAVAASIAIMAVIGGLGALFLSPKPAFGLHDLRQRLLQLESFQLQGWVYPDGTTPHRQQWYVERSGGFRIDGPDFFWASDGPQYLVVNHARKTAVIGTELPLWTRIRIEGLMQTDIVQELIGAGTASERNLGTRTIEGGRVVQVYERILRVDDTETGRIELWIDPETRLPVRSTIQRINRDGVRLWAVYDSIRADEPRPADIFDLEPPEGYAVTRHDRQSEEICQWKSETNGGRDVAHLRFAFNIRHQAILVCWSKQVKDESGRLVAATASQPLNVRIDDRKAWPHQSHHLRTDRAVDQAWHWELLVPDNGQVPEGGFTFFIDGGKHQARLTPLLFQDDLADVIDQAQKLTAPSTAPIDLPDLLTLLRSHPHSLSVN